MQGDFERTVESQGDTQSQGDTGSQGDAIRFDLSEQRWRQTAPGRIKGPVVYINGAGMHLEGIAVKEWHAKSGATLQVEKYDECGADFDGLSELTSDSLLQTATIYGEEYVLFMVPFSR